MESIGDSLLLLSLYFSARFEFYNSNLFLFDYGLFLNSFLKVFGGSL